MELIASTLTSVTGTAVGTALAYLAAPSVTPFAMINGVVNYATLNFNNMPPIIRNDPRVQGAVVAVSLTMCAVTSYKYSLHLQQMTEYITDSVIADATRSVVNLAVRNIQKSVGVKPYQARLFDSIKADINKGLLSTYDLLEAFGVSNLGFLFEPLNAGMHIHHAWQLQAQIKYNVDLIEQLITAFGEESKLNIPPSVKTTVIAQLNKNIRFFKNLYNVIHVQFPRTNIESRNIEQSLEKEIAAQEEVARDTANAMGKLMHDAKKAVDAIKTAMFGGGKIDQLRTSLWKRAFGAMQNNAMEINLKTGGDMNEIAKSFTESTDFKEATEIFTISTVDSNGNTVDYECSINCEEARKAQGEAIARRKHENVYREIFERYHEAKNPDDLQPYDIDTQIIDDHSVDIEKYKATQRTDAIEFVNSFDPVYEPAYTIEEFGVKTDEMIRNFALLHAEVMKRHITEIDSNMDELNLTTHQRHEAEQIKHNIATDMASVWAPASELWRKFSTTFGLTAAGLKIIQAIYYEAGLTLLSMVWGYKAGNVKYKAAIFVTTIPFIVLTGVKSLSTDDQLSLTSSLLLYVIPHLMMDFFIFMKCIRKVVTVAAKPIYFLGNLFNLNNSERKQLEAGSEESHQLVLMSRGASLDVARATQLYIDELKRKVLLIQESEDQNTTVAEDAYDEKKLTIELVNETPVLKNITVKSKIVNARNQSLATTQNLALLVTEEEEDDPYDIFKRSLQNVNNPRMILP